MVELPDGLAGFYTIENNLMERGDWLYDSDAYKYDLKYSHVGVNHVTPNPN